MSGVCDQCDIAINFNMIFYSILFIELTISFALFYHSEIEALITDLRFSMKGEFTLNENEVEISFKDWLFLLLIVAFTHSASRHERESMLSFSHSLRVNEP